MKKLDFVKSYLRVDFDEDDEYIKLLMDVADKYIQNACGNHDKNDPYVKLLALTIISSLYGNREFAVSENLKKSPIISSIILHLNLSGGADDE